MARLMYSEFDVCRILGVVTGGNVPAPEPADGEVVIYYGGWSLKQLRQTDARQWCRWLDFYDRCGWKAEPGYYRLLLTVPHSNRMRWNDQLQHLASISAAWQPASICVAATALLVHLTETGEDLLRGDWCRCAEMLSGFSRPALEVRDDGRVDIFRHWDDARHDDLWLSAAQKVV